MTPTPTDLEGIAEKFQEELNIARRHARQLASLDPEARKRVRDQIDRMLGEEKPSGTPR